MDPLGLSPADVSNIIANFNIAVDHMTAVGQRTSPASWNNLNRNLYDISNGNWGANYKGCGEQAETIQDILKSKEYEDGWTFSITGSNFASVQPGRFMPNGPHWWVTAKSNNPNDPVITLDPWRNYTYTSK